MFVAEGVHLVREALESGAEIELFARSPRLRESDDGLKLARRIDADSRPSFEAGDAALDSVQDARSAQPVLAVVRRPSWPEDVGFDTPESPLIVAACGVQDPGNLGAIVRTADAAGASACFVCGSSADPFHPRAVRATMGSLFRLPVLRDDAEAVRQRMRERHVLAVAADPHAGQPYFERDLTVPLGLFLGAEGAGLPDTLRDSLDVRLHIPLRAGVESLSVNAAAAVLLFEAGRQRAADRSR